MHPKGFGTIMGPLILRNTLQDWRNWTARPSSNTDADVFGADTLELRVKDYLQYSSHFANDFAGTDNETLSEQGLGGALSEWTNGSHSVTLDLL